MDSNRFDMDNRIHSLAKNKKVVELCCGRGDIIQKLKSEVKEIIGIELSEERIALCKEKFRKDKKVKIMSENISKIPLKSGEYDLVIIKMGLHHVKDINSVLYESSRILKTGGKFIIVDKFLTGNLLLSNLYDLYLFLKTGRKDFFQHHYRTEEEVKKVAEKYFRIRKRIILPYQKGIKNKLYLKYLYILEKR
ncbi:MAG: methyltransferase domain-containing protein [Candidatus Aenigmarchaeota archaeon]|nr:methyltransferase domain-containing protein [Candidatus Aenigmarchaeota archaeon]